MAESKQSKPFLPQQNIEAARFKLAHLQTRNEMLEKKVEELTKSLDTAKEKAQRFDMFLNDIVFRALNVFSVFTVAIDITTVSEDGKYVISCQSRSNSKVVRVVVRGDGVQVIDSKELIEEYSLVKFKEGLEYAVCVIDEELLEQDDDDYEEVNEYDQPNVSSVDSLDDSKEDEPDELQQNDGVESHNSSIGRDIGSGEASPIDDESVSVENEDESNEDGNGNNGHNGHNGNNGNNNEEEDEEEDDSQEGTSHTDGNVLNW
jgi:hypothetical protein